MSIKDEIRLEMESTQKAFHALLAKIPDEAFHKPSDNPAWTIGEVLFHMSIAPRFMAADLKAIVENPWFARAFGILVPAPLFNRLNEFSTRYWARNLNRRFLANQYDKAHDRAMKAFEPLKEDDFHKSLRYPDYDPMLSGVVTIEMLYRYIKRHFDVHAEQITRILALPE